MKRFFFLRPLLTLPHMPSDPGYMQLNGAIRTVCIVLLTGLIVVPVSAVMGWPLTTCALSIVFAMISGVLFRDAFAADKLKTLLYGALCAAAAYLVATLIAHQSVMLGNISFVCVGVLCVLLHTQGARIASIGLGGFVFYYLGLLVTPSLSQVIHAWLLLVIACLSFCVWSFWLLPNRPHQNLRRMISAICASAQQLINHIDQAKKEGLTTAKKIQLNRSLSVLNEFILAAEAQLSLTEISASVQIRQYLRDLEIAVQVYSRHLQQSADTLEASHAQAVKEAMHILDYFHQMLSQPQVLTHHSVLPAASAAAPLAWQHALKTAVAGFIGLALGYMISDQRWYWSMFAVLVIYLGAKTTNEVTVRAAERVAGTVLGLIFVAGVSSLIHGNTLLEVIVILISIFFWAYFIATNYTIGVMFATSQSLFAYEKLGVNLSDLLPLRFDENVLGSLAAVLVAYLLFPVKSRTFESTKARAILSRLSMTLLACQQKMAGNDSVQAVEELHKFDTAVKEWRKINRPQHIKRLFIWWKDSGINRQSWSAVQHWTHSVLRSVEKTADRLRHNQTALAAWTVQSDRLMSHLQQLNEQTGQGKALTHQELISLAVSLAALSDTVSHAAEH